MTRDLRFVTAVLATAALLGSCSQISTSRKPFVKDLISKSGSPPKIGSWFSTKRSERRSRLPLD